MIIMMMHVAAVRIAFRSRENLERELYGGRTKCTVDSLMICLSASTRTTTLSSACSQKSEMSAVSRSSSLYFLSDIVSFGVGLPKPMESYWKPVGLSIYCVLLSQNKLIATTLWLHRVRLWWRNKSNELSWTLQVIKPLSSYRDSILIGLQNKSDIKTPEGHSGVRVTLKKTNGIWSRLQLVNNNEKSTLTSYLLKHTQIITGRFSMSKEIGNTYLIIAKFLILPKR